ncbi:MAG: potassium transporter TrkG [Paracoccaceae bacterium]
MVQRLLDLPVFVLLMGVCALAMWVPAVYAVIVDDNATARAFFYSGVIWLLFTGLIAIVTASYPANLAPRSNLLALALAYALLPLMAAVPVVQAVPDTAWGNAWFEMVSSFTTTGASVYDVPGRLPDAVHLWRAIIGWFGGLFILIAALAVLAPMNLGGVELISGRASVRASAGTTQVTQVADAAARVARGTTLVFPAYLGLTVVLWVGLIALGNPGDGALVFAMGVISTSGITFGPAALAPVGGFWAELLMFLFLWVAVTRKSIPGLALTDRKGRLRDDVELRLAGLIVLGTAMVLLLRYWHAVGVTLPLADIAAGFWAAVYTTLSFLTTTGYMAADWPIVSIWSGAGTPGMILIGLVIVGGGVATTAGGVKLLRVYALFRQGEHELVRLVHPNAVGGRGEQARRLRQEGASLAWIFFMIFALTLAAVMMALTLTGVPFTEAMVLAVASLSTTGPLAEVAGPMPLSYADLSGPAQAVLAVTMVVGRLETLAILVLFARDSWQR